MTLRVVGCSHHRSSVAVREQLAFNAAQTARALDAWRGRFPRTEVVLLSTCNRVELYCAALTPEDDVDLPRVAQFLAEFHGLPVDNVRAALFEQDGEDAIRHLFRVAASLDSMVVGESQILAQVKQAYQLAQRQESAGSTMHLVFQSALRVARRVASETIIHHHRVSIPSVAIADFARQIFERFDDKRVVVVGAGEMGEETLRYLHQEGARSITVVNRSPERARQLAARFRGRSEPWDKLHAVCREADLIISATGGTEPIVTSADYARGIAPDRAARPLMILDLAIPRDFDPEISRYPGVYLYSIDDLAAACQRNRQARNRDLPAALRIVDTETRTFMADLHHRCVSQVIVQLRQGWHEPKREELARLFRQLPDLDDRSRKEITQAFDRLVNKLLHPAMQSLRHESRHGPPIGLLDAIKRLFQLND